MNKMLEYAANSGLKEAEIFIKDITSNEVSFENNNLKKINSSQNSGIGIRAIIDGKMGTCSFTHESEAPKSIERLKESAKYAEPKMFEFSKPAQYSNPMICDKYIKKISMDKLVKDGEKIIEKVLQYDKNLYLNLSFGFDITKTSLSNSFGMEGEYDKSVFLAYLDGQIIEGTNFIQTDCYKYSIDAGYDIDLLVNTFIERIKYSRNDSVFNSARTNVLFTPKIFTEILSTIEEGVNGLSIEKGVSPLCNRIGETIFDERFTLIDDGTLDNMYGSRPFDDEGVPVRKNVILENGVLKKYVHSLRTAAKTNSEPTGNGNRGSYTAPPSPNFNNMIVAPGTVSFEEMLEKMQNGIIIDEIMGMHTNNILNGDFGGTIQLGFKVENGKIAGRIKNAAINSNIYKILKDNLVELSDLNYTHPLVNSVFSTNKQPCALFKDINITVK